jgi:molybdopterin/thiamine biosynthesis adenylyltransferase
MIEVINPEARVECLQADVRDDGPARALAEVDAIFSCTDTHASRAIINQVAYQFVVPAFDVGVSIQAKDGRVTRITGRAQMLAPGVGCLVCGDMLDWAEVRRELQTDAERAADRYIMGDVEPQPAVISLNSTMSSLAVTMFLAAFTGVPSEARLLFYDAIEGRLRPAQIRPAPTCVVCSQSGALAQASNWPLPTRNLVNG